MRIIDYGFESKSNHELTEYSFEELNIGLILDIVDNKYKILKMMSNPSFHINDEKLYYIDKISVHKKGVLFDLKVLSNNDIDLNEFARIYFMNNGEAHFVLEELSSKNIGRQKRNDNVIEILDKKIGKPLKLIKENESNSSLFTKSKIRNKLVMESCKKKILESLGFYDNEIFIIDRVNNKDSGLKLEIKCDL